MFRPWLILAGALLQVSTSWAARPIRLAFMGDVMPGTTWPAPDRPAQPDRLWGPVTNVLKGADLAFANLEGSLTDGGHPTKASGSGHACGSYYSFRLPTRDADVLARAGVSAVSLANNHAGDFGPEALAQAPVILARTHVMADGPEGREPASWIQDGQRWTLLAFAPNSGVRDLRNIESAERLVQAAKAKGGLVVVSMHAGGEGVGHEHVRPGVENYLGENRGNPIEFAHAVIDAGADIVYGHGPHVPRAIELYRGHLILYSLGNGMTHGGIRREGAEALTPVVVTTLDASTGKLIGGTVYSFVQHPRQALESDPGARAGALIQTLTREDFPNTDLGWTGERFWPIRENTAATLSQTALSQTANR